MSKVPERYTHWDERRDLVEIGHLSVREGRVALLRSLATMHQALETFERTAELLGDRAFVDPAGGDAYKILHVRDGDWIVCEPLIVIAFVPTSFTVMQFRVKDAVTPIDEGRAPDKILPDIVPQTRMRSGSIRIAEGDRLIEVVYDDDGKFKESTVSVADPWIPLRYPNRRHVIDPHARPPARRPISLALRADLDPSGVRPEALARMILDVAPSAGRIRAPAPLPGGARGVWVRALGSLRRRIFDLRDARFAIVDGLDATSFGAGATREQARAAWEADLFRAKPKPPVAQVSSEPPPPHEEPRIERDEKGDVKSVSTGTIHISIDQPGPAIDWPSAIPANMPAAMIELPDLPSDIPARFAEAGFDRWVRIVASLGDVHGALARRDRQGWTLIGEGIVDIVDPVTLDDQLDARDASDREDWPGDKPWEDPRFFSRVDHYACWDLGRQRTTTFTLSGGSWSPLVLSPAMIEGERAHYGVVRGRELR